MHAGMRRAGRGRCATGCRPGSRHVAAETRAEIERDLPGRHHRGKRGHRLPAGIAGVGAVRPAAGGGSGATGSGIGAGGRSTSDVRSCEAAAAAPDFVVAQRRTNSAGPIGAGAAHGEWLRPEWRRTKQARRRHRPSRAPAAPARLPSPSWPRFRRKSRRIQACVALLPDLCGHSACASRNGMPDALIPSHDPPFGQADRADGPRPLGAEIDTILTIASRVPDHGKLTPWRFIVFEGEARSAIGETIAEAFKVGPAGCDRRPDRIRAHTGWRARRW